MPSLLKILTGVSFKPAKAFVSNLFKSNEKPEAAADQQSFQDSVAEFVAFIDTTPPPSVSQVFDAFNSTMSRSLPSDSSEADIWATKIEFLLDAYNALRNFYASDSIPKETENLLINVMIRVFSGCTSESEFSNLTKTYEWRDEIMADLQTNLQSILGIIQRGQKGTEIKMHEGAARSSTDSLRWTAYFTSLLAFMIKAGDPGSLVKDFLQEKVGDKTFFDLVVWVDSKKKSKTAPMYPFVLKALIDEKRIDLLLAALAINNDKTPPGKVFTDFAISNPSACIEILSKIPEDLDIQIALNSLAFNIAPDAYLDFIKKILKAGQYSLLMPALKARNSADQVMQEVLARELTLSFHQLLSDIFAHEAQKMDAVKDYIHAHTAPQLVVKLATQFPQEYGKALPSLIHDFGESITFDSLDATGKKAIDIFCSLNFEAYPSLIKLVESLKDTGDTRRADIIAKKLIEIFTEHMGKDATPENVGSENFDIVPESIFHANVAYLNKNNARGYGMLARFLMENKSSFLLERTLHFKTPGKNIYSLPKTPTPLENQELDLVEDLPDVIKNPLVEVIQSYITYAQELEKSKKKLDRDKGAQAYSSGIQLLHIAEKLPQQRTDDPDFKRFEAILADAIKLTRQEGNPSLLHTMGAIVLAPLVISFGTTPGRLYETTREVSLNAIKEEYDKLYPAQPVDRDRYGFLATPPSSESGDSPFPDENIKITRDRKK